MARRIIQQFNQFIRMIDEKVMEFVDLEDNKLTKHISSIQWSLWKNYKEINGISAGFHGISEYIVFSTFKRFIENLNKPQRFSPQPINRDLRFFELTKNNKVLTIYRAASLKHFPLSLKSNRAPDIAILKKEGNNFKLVAVIEVKNFLDKGSTNSAIDILSQIQKAVKDDNTKYAIFSFWRISVKDKETQKRLREFQENENNFLITNEKENKKRKFRVIDLLDFFNAIKDEIVL